MHLEQSGLLDRVTDLEKRTNEQASEIAFLKSSLADCLRRIGLLESTQGTALCDARSNPTGYRKPGVKSMCELVFIVPYAQLYIDQTCHCDTADCVLTLLLFGFYIV